MGVIRVLFAGSGTLGLGVLAHLARHESFEITSVVLLDEKPSGRGLKIVASSLEKAASANKLIIHKIDSEKAVAEIVKREQPTIVLVACFGIIISESALRLSTWINIHPSLLPLYRGATPVQQALLDGETKTGISWIRMIKKMDAGPIIAQSVIPIYTEDDFSSLWERIESKAADETPYILKSYLEKPSEQKQDDAQVSYCSKIRKEDGHINFSKEGAEAIIRKVRAYSGWPTSYFFLNKMRIKIVKARAIEHKLYPEEIALENGRFIIGTAAISLEILTLQPESKRQMSSQDFLRGLRHMPKTIS